MRIGEHAYRHVSRAENVYRPTPTSESGGCSVALAYGPTGGPACADRPAVAKVETKTRWTSLSITGKEPAADDARMVRMESVMHNPKLADTWLINGYKLERVGSMER